MYVDINQILNIVSTIDRLVPLDLQGNVLYCTFSLSLDIAISAKWL